MHFERKYLLFCLRVVTFSCVVFRVVGDTQKLKASEMHRMANFSHEQTETDLFYVFCVLCLFILFQAMKTD